jgi:quinol monooxygenase YgiN
MVIVIGEMKIDPRHLDDFLAEVDRLERISRAEDGCISYAMALDDRATATIAVSERWRDEPALRTHLAQPGVAAFIQKCGPWILAMDAKLYDGANERNVV